MLKMSLQIVVSHTKTFDYLYHCLDILEQVGFNRRDIWVDGYKSHCQELIGKVAKVTMHELDHGIRCYDILKEATSDYVIIMDSDFFCCDPEFWKDVLGKVAQFPLSAIRRMWYDDRYQLTTPFVVYQREKILQIAPTRAAWNHFIRVFPDMPDPIFDHLQYLFLLVMKNGQAGIIDEWDITKRKYKFSHLWDSRHTYEENFKDFEDPDIDLDVRYKYLVYGVSKYIFHYVAGNAPELNDQVWGYMRDIREKHSKLWLDYIQDVIENLGDQVMFKSDWLERFNTFKLQYSQNL